MKRQPYEIGSKHVPYVSTKVMDGALVYLPANSHAELTIELVAYFVTSTRERPDARLAVLGTLRTHAANGAEVPLSAMALLFSGFALLFAGFHSLPLVATIMGAVVVIAALSVIRMSVAAHARKLVAAAWLAAYEDGIAGKYGRLRAQA